MFSFPPRDLSRPDLAIDCQRRRTAMVGRKRRDRSLLFRRLIVVCSKLNLHRPTIASTLGLRGIIFHLTKCCFQPKRRVFPVVPGGMLHSCVTRCIRSGHRSQMLTRSGHKIKKNKRRHYRQTASVNYHWHH